MLDIVWVSGVIILYDTFLESIDELVVVLDDELIVFKELFRCVVLIDGEFSILSFFSSFLSQQRNIS